MQRLMALMCTRLHKVLDDMARLNISTEYSNCARQEKLREIKCKAFVQAKTGGFFCWSRIHTPPTHQEHHPSNHDGRHNILQRLPRFQVPLLEVCTVAGRLFAVVSKLSAVCIIIMRDQPRICMPHMHIPPPHRCFWIVMLAGVAGRLVGVGEWVGNLDEQEALIILQPMSVQLFRKTATRGIRASTCCV